MSTSPKAAASRGVPARALGPSLAASALSCSRLREENITPCPAFTQTAPSAPPTLPEPTMPIFIFPAAVRAARAVSGKPSSAAAAAMIPRNRRRSCFISIYYNRGKHLRVHDTIDLPRRGHSPRGPAVRRTAWKRGGSSYGFALVLPLGAHYGQRGLTAAPPFMNRVAYAGNIVGAGGLLVGTLVLLWGAYAAL